MELNFYNGHSCSPSGIAESDKGALVYRDASDPAAPCELRIVQRKGRIEFEDINMHCRSSGGARGGYGETGLSVARRRPITAAQRKEALSDYKKALDEQREKTRP